jgi:hypothetical protein
MAATLPQSTHTSEHFFRVEPASKTVIGRAAARP